MSFKDKILKAIKREKSLTERVVSFSHKMMEEMELTQNDIGLAHHYKVCWDVGEYVIYPESRAWNDWKIILEVIPYDVFHNMSTNSVGWSNISHNPLPKGWEYIPDGTCTKVLPSDSDKARIIDAIRRKKKSIFN